MMVAAFQCNFCREASFLIETVNEGKMAAANCHISWKRTFENYLRVGFSFTDGNSFNCFTSRWEKCTLFPHPDLDRKFRLWKPTPFLWTTFPSGLNSGQGLGWKWAACSTMQFSTVTRNSFFSLISGSWGTSSQLTLLSHSQGRALAIDTNPNLLVLEGLPEIKLWSKQCQKSNTIYFS